MKKSVYIIIGLLLLFSFLTYRSYQSAIRYKDDPNSDQRVAINVPKGSSADDIAQLLLDKNLIRSPTFFKWYLRLNGMSGKLKAGRFVLQENDDLPAIASALVDGKSAEQAVTLLEGWTAQQIGDYLEGLGLTTADNFVKCVKTCAFKSPIIPAKGSVEGYLYPDTYFVDAGSYSDQAFIARLINTLESKLTDADLKAVKASKHSLSDVIKMASIVEREERDPAQRPTIAGILWKRFDNGIGLGADATLLYGLGRTSGGLDYNDLQTDSPYNTRKYRGLPPTPISNPHISSIEAAIFPKDSPYMYYLHGSDGQVHYGKTLEEHNENKRKYLQ
jgi:UPF0755 protein